VVLVLLDHKDKQVSLVLRALKVEQEQQAYKAPLEDLVQQARPDLKGEQVEPARQGQLVQLDHWDRLEELVLVERLDHRV
jgi:hypothetical protein